MAVTRIWPVYNRIDKVVKYVENEKKTVQVKTHSDESEMSSGLNNVLNYSVNPNKTEKHFFVTAINCSKENAVNQMMETKNQFKKTGGIVAFHMYQSFKPGEVTPETAHEIGVKFAKEIIGERFETIVSTHLDKQHLHNHIIFNSVSYVDGYKFYDQTKVVYQMQNASDKLCREYGLNVIENPKGRRISHNEYMSKKNGVPTNNEIIIRDIDECIAASVTMNEFYSRMKEKGYSFDNSHKYTTISHPKFNRPRRLKTLGEDYTESRIEARINKHLLPYEEEIPPQDDTDLLFDEQYKSYEMPHLRFIYARYTFEINTWIERPLYNKYKLYLIKDDIKKLDRLADEQNVLITNDLYTNEDIISFINKCDSELAMLDKERAKLRNQLKTAVSNGDDNKIRELKEAISSYSETMKKTRHEKSVCQRVLNELPELTEKVKEVGRQNEKIREEKEAKENESSRRFGRRNR